MRLGPEAAADVTNHYRQAKPAAAPPAAAAPRRGPRSEDEIDSDIKQTSASAPLSAAGSSSKSRKLAALKAENQRRARDETWSEMERGLLGRFNSATSEAEDLIIKKRSGEGVDDKKSDAVSSSLSSLLAELRGKAETSSMLVPVEIRPGTSIETDISNVVYLLKELDK